MDKAAARACIGIYSDEDEAETKKKSTAPIVFCARQGHKRARHWTVTCVLPTPDTAALPVLRLLLCLLAVACTESCLTYNIFHSLGHEHLVSFQPFARTSLVRFASKGPNVTVCRGL